MKKIYKVTPLRTHFDSDDERGTKTENGYQVVPTTPKLLKDNGIDLPDEFSAPTPLTKDLNTDKLHNNLRPYQYDDVLKLSTRAAGCILSEPRTGKTPTAISVFKQKGLKKFMVICPKSIVLAWKQEIIKWYPGIQVHVIEGSAVKRKKEYDNWESGALILGYERVRIDQESLLEHLKPRKHAIIEGLIVDEAHILKNHRTKTYSAIKKFSKVEHKLFLSGTIASNKPEEIFGPLSIAFPQVFNGYYNFLNYYFNTKMVKNWAAGGIDTMEIDGFKRELELQQFIDNVGTRRTQKEVLPWIKEVIPTEIKLQPTKQQVRYIKELETMFEVDDVIVQNTISALTKIRQICLAPEIADLTGQSPKENWIKDYIQDNPDESIVIFSNSTKFLLYLSEKLNTKLMVTGQHSLKERQRSVDAFQKSKKQKILLVNTVAGKEGLTLDAATTAIFTDTIPPASNMLQARERITNTVAERVGEDKKIFYLSMEGTYDERLFDLVAQNIENIDPVNNYKDYLKGRK